MILYEPSCLITTDNGFKYSDEFQACRISLSNYLSGLDRFYDCTDGELKELFNVLLAETRKTYNCYVDVMKDKSETDLSARCSGVEAPRFLKSHLVDGLNYDFGLPRCVRKNASYNSAAKVKFQLEDCRAEIEAFHGSQSFSFGLSVKSAQQQYDSYMANLKVALNQKGEDAVKKFNCLANRQSYCF